MIIPIIFEDRIKKALSLEVEMLQGERRDLPFERVEYKINVEVEKRMNIVEFSYETYKERPN